MTMKETGNKVGEEDLIEEILMMVEDLMEEKTEDLMDKERGALMVMMIGGLRDRRKEDLMKIGDRLLIKTEDKVVTKMLLILQLCLLELLPVTKNGRD